MARVKKKRRPKRRAPAPEQEEISAERSGGEPLAEEERSEAEAPDALSSEDLTGELLTPPPDEKRRGWILGALGLLLFLQIAVPASYYFGDDPYDERFSWRMFSDVRLRSCNLIVSEGREGAFAPIQPRTSIHVAWINTMKRGRDAVVERYLRFRCAHATIEGARAQLSCRDPSGDAVPPVRWEIACGSGEIARTEGEAPASPAPGGGGAP